MVEHTRMKTFRFFEEVPRNRHVVSIGTFDGMHLGHQFLMKCAKERAFELGVLFLVITFEPPPSKVIRPESYPGRLVTAARKMDLLEVQGVPATLVLDFTLDMMMMPPEAFISELHGAAHPVELWVGEEFALGHNRTGNVEHLVKVGLQHGMRLHAVPRISHNGEVVSSSRIRKHVLAGEVKAAHDLLGQPYQLAGVVIEGAKIGRTIGYPTANVEPSPDLVALPDGIYVSLAGLPGEPVHRPAMTYIGMRPALNTGNRLIETHLLDFSSDIYGMTLTVDILERLRPDATFAGVDALVRQLQEDERNTRRMLANLWTSGFEVMSHNNRGTSPITSD